MLNVDSEDTIDLEEYLIENRPATFSLLMKGNAMQDEGILDGDLVIVERGKTPKQRDIVVAEIDEEYQLKKMSSLKSNQKTTVVAVVVAIVRKYR